MPENASHFMYLLGHLGGVYGVRDRGSGAGLFPLWNWSSCGRWLPPMHSLVPWSGLWQKVDAWSLNLPRTVPAWGNALLPHPSVVLEGPEFVQWLGGRRHIGRVSTECLYSLPMNGPSRSQYSFLPFIWREGEQKTVIY